MSYLFYGPKGIGKSFTARQFAKTLNCQAQGEDCCDACSSCLRMDKLQHPDLHWLDLEGGSDNIKIEQVRQMQADMSLKPFEGKVKVFVINNCEDLTLEAANCLLKILEEPLFDSVIILISSKVRLLLPTIASRCQKIKFSGIKRQEAEEILQKVYKIDGPTSRYLSYYSDGRIGEAIALNKDNVLAQRNIILDKFMFDFNQRQAEELFKDSAQARRVLSILVSWFRDLLYVKLSDKSKDLINQDRAQEIEKEAKRYSYLELFTIFQCLTQSFEYLDRNINVRLLIDNLRVKIWKD